MRPTLGYGLMTVCLSSVLAYSGFSATKSQGVVRDEADQPTALIQGESTTNRPIAPDLGGFARKVSIGDTGDEVVAALGQPSSIDATKNRWTYGSQVLLFKNDRLAGCVKLDAMQSPRAKLLNSHAQFAASVTHAKNMSHGYGSRITALKRSSGYSRYSTARAYSTLWMPMFQLYYSDRPLGRGASPATRGADNNPLRTGSFYQPPFSRR